MDSWLPTRKWVQSANWAVDLSSLLGAAGGASGLGGAGGSPSPFGLGNLLPGVLQGPFNRIFGGGGSVAVVVSAGFLAEVAPVVPVVRVAAALISAGLARV